MGISQSLRPAALRHLCSAKSAPIVATISVSPSKCHMTVAERNAFDPILNYLNSLEWDGVQRVGNMCDLFAVEDNELNREFLNHTYHLISLPKAVNSISGLSHKRIQYLTDGDRLTSTQRGKIAELHVATALMAQTGGRLSPFEPLSDDHGVDLVVLDKVTGASLPIQVKSWFLSPDKPTSRVQFDVQKTTHSTGQRGAIVCVVLEPTTLAISVGWVIPLDMVASVGINQAHKYALAPSRLATSNDKYTKFRCHTLGELATAVTAQLH